MTDKFLHHRPGRVLETLFDSPAQLDSGEIDDFHSFGWLRGMRERAIMIELRKKSGDMMAVAYSWIERVDFNPTVGITLHVHGDEIHIKGRNLNSEVRPNVRLFQGIIQQRVAWVRETGRGERSDGGDRTTVIEEFVW
jgi:hypothetical protein